MASVPRIPPPTTATTTINMPGPRAAIWVRDSCRPRMTMPIRRTRRADMAKPGAKVAGMRIRLPARAPRMMHTSTALTMGTARCSARAASATAKESATPGTQARRVGSFGPRPAGVTAPEQSG